MTSAARSAIPDVGTDARVWWHNLGRWILGGVAVVAIIVFALPRAFRSLDYFHVQKVQLDGARYLLPSTVTAALGHDTTASVFDPPETFARKIEKLPLVARVSVKRRLPGTLVVTVAERVPVALVATRDGFRGVDSLGNRLPLDPAVSSFDAPVVLPAAGVRDTNADRRLFALLGRIRLEDPALFDALEEARRVSRTEWQLRTSANHVVRVTPEVTLARLADIFPVEQDLARRRIRAAEIDLRYRNHVIARLP